MAGVNSFRSIVAVEDWLRNPRSARPGYSTSMFPPLNEAIWELVMARSPAKLQRQIRTLHRNARQRRIHAGPPNECRRDSQVEVRAGKVPVDPAFTDQNPVASQR